MCVVFMFSRLTASQIEFFRMVDEKIALVSKLKSTVFAKLQPVYCNRSIDMQFSRLGRHWFRAARHCMTLTLSPRAYKYIYGMHAGLLENCSADELKVVFANV